MGIATAKAAFGKFFRAPTTAFISYTTQHIQTSEEDRELQRISPPFDNTQQRPLRKTVDGEHSTLSHSHDVKFFTQKAKGGNPPTVY